MRHAVLASLAIVLGALAAAPAPMAQAQTVTGSGWVTYVPHSTETLVLPDGNTLERSHLKGVVIAADPEVPFHLSSQDCSGTNVLGSDGAPLLGSGYCEGVDRDGDVWWIWWRNAPDGDTWGFTAGTGKYEGIEGGGTTQPQFQGSDGRFVISWEGTWQMK